MATSQRAGILPITFITPSLKPGPTHIALSNRQTLFTERRAGTRSTICKSGNITNRPRSVGSGEDSARGLLYER